MSKLHSLTLTSICDAVVAGLAPLDAPPPQTLSEWAAENFILSAEGSQTPGGWEAYPFQPGWMDAFSNDDIEEVTVKKSKRVGYTKTLLAFMAYNAAHRRRKQALWQPTDDDRDSFVKTEVDPMLRDVAALHAVRRPSNDTMSLKAFLGSVLHLLGGKATTSYRRITVAVSLLDELDGFDRLIEKSADPVTLAGGRLEGAPFPKLVGGSTPRVKNRSHVEDREVEAGAIMQFRVPCPHCHVETPLIWGGPKISHGFKWDDGQVETVRHVCPHCREPMSQQQYLEVWVLGRWADIEGRYAYDHRTKRWLDARVELCRPPRHVAFRIWGAYSPQRTWPDIVREFLEAKSKADAGEFGPLQGFVNETLGETWEVRSDSADEHELAQRPQTYEIRTVPPGVLTLVAGVDTQDARFEVAVWGFGRGEEMWLIDYVIIQADPGDERDWEKLDGYLQTTFDFAERPGGMSISGAAVDIGGHFTHAVYNFARKREYRRIVAIHGSKFDGRPIKGKASRQDVNWRGTIVKKGVRLWEVGTDTAKDLLHARLGVKRPGPGFVHFPSGLPAMFFPGLTSEGRVLQRTSTGERYRWVKKRPNARNEPLDTTVYAIFMSHLLDLHRYTPAMWAQLERKHAVKYDAPKEPPKPVSNDEDEPTPAPRRRRRGRIGSLGGVR